MLDGNNQVATSDLVQIILGAVIDSALATLLLLKINYSATVLLNKLQRHFELFLAITSKKPHVRRAFKERKECGTFRAVSIKEKLSAVTCYFAKEGENVVHKN